MVKIILCFFVFCFFKKYFFPTSETLYRLAYINHKKISLRKKTKQTIMETCTYIWPLHENDEGAVDNAARADQRQEHVPELHLKVKGHRLQLGQQGNQLARQIADCILVLATEACRFRAWD